MLAASTQIPPEAAASLDRARRALPWAWRDAALPVLIYTAAFCALTWPAVLSFGSHFFCDGGDGLQSVWNLWWTRKAVVELHQSPWWTSWIHFPHGTTLVGHTLSAFNGLLAIPLSVALGPVQVHNALVAVGFVGGGWAAFLLARDVVGGWWPSVVAGFAFTFSGYHFAHAEGHLNLVSLEWVPIFVLCWLRLLRQPTVRRALLAAGALGLVLLCDYYYVLLCVLMAVALAAWRAAQRRDVLFLLRRPYAAPLGAFVLASLLTSGVLVVALLSRPAADPFIGSHDAALYSNNLLAGVLPGGHSAWAALTAGYWGALPGNIHESSVYVGLVVLALAVFGFAQRRAVAFADAPMWLALAAVFFVLSFGPALRWRGEPLTGAWMPYRWLELLLPPVRMSGSPGRMILVASLALSLLAAAGISAVLRPATPGRVAAAALLAGAVLVNLWPRPLTLTRPEVPEWVLVLRDRPGAGALLDLSGTAGAKPLFFQTVHGKPIAFGYISRISRSTVRANDRILDDVRLGRYDRIRDVHGFRYLVTPGREPPGPGILYDGPGARLYDLAAAF